MTEPAMTPDAPPADDRRAHLRGRSLRQHAARGTIVNGLFLTAVSGLSLFRGFAVALFLTRKEFGIYGIVIATLSVLGMLRDVGIADRYIQQDDLDQELAFQKAFTLELMLELVFAGLVCVLVPIMALVYGRDDLLAPGFFCILVPLALAFQVPIWIQYRQMNFVRQRMLQALDPIVAFVVTIALAAAGAGYWSLLIGIVVGQWATAVVAVLSSPYPLAIRYDHGTFAAYWRFSAPLFVGALGGIVIAQSSVLIGNGFLGVAGVGAIALAAQVSQVAERVDQIVTGTLYPAICAVRDRKDLLYESFVKSNRLALMWGLPFGIGLALFAPALVHHGLGDEWAPAIPLLQVFGLVAGLNQVAFNWTAYLRAVGNTRPIAVVNLVGAAAFLAATISLTAAFGIDGFAAGVGVYGAVFLLARSVAVARLFDGFSFVSQAMRAAAPTLPAVAATLAVRAVDGGLPVSVRIAAELATFVGLTAVATWRLERDLLGEAVGYLTADAPPATPSL